MSVSEEILNGNLTFTYDISVYYSLVMERWVF